MDVHVYFKFLQREVLFFRFLPKKQDGVSIREYTHVMYISFILDAGGQ